MCLPNHSNKYLKPELLLFKLFSIIGIRSGLKDHLQSISSDVLWPSRCPQLTSLSLHVSPILRTSKESKAAGSRFY